MEIRSLGGPDPSRPPLQLTVGRADNGQYQMELTFGDMVPMRGAAVMCDAAAQIVQSFVAALMMSPAAADHFETARLAAYASLLRVISTDLTVIANASTE